MKIGFVITNAATTVATHSTVHVAVAAASRGHAVRFFEPWDFEVDTRGRVRGRAHVLEAGSISREKLSDDLVSRRFPRRSVEVDQLDVLLLRTNPLHDAVLTFAQLAAAAGVRVYNPPDSIIRTAHKSWLATLSGVPRPRTLVSRSRATLEVFAMECPHGVVLKPARSSGGRGVSIAMGEERSNLDAAIAAAERSGDGYIVAQEYVPAAALGEKRLVWLDGRLLGGYLRQRPEGDFRHNLKVGGTPEPCRLSEGDLRLCDVLSPHLQRAGIWLAGIDVIGGLVVEVNTLNPGGLHYASHFSGEDLATAVIRQLEGRSLPVAAPLSAPLSTPNLLPWRHDP